MGMSELDMHFMDEKAPKVTVEKYSDFSVVKVTSAVLPEIKLFFYSAQKLTNFKNSFLWAFENPTKIG